MNEYCLANAAESNSEYVKNEDLPFFIENLGRIGKFSAARTATARITTSSTQNSMMADFNRYTAERTIVLNELAVAAWAHPEQIINYGAFNALTDVVGNKSNDLEIGLDYGLLAGKIVEKFEDTLVPPGLEKLLQPKVLRHGANATLDDLLHVRWPNMIEKLPTQKQGDLWNFVAQIYTEMGDNANAAIMLDRAEQSGAFDFKGENRVYVSTTWSWIKLENYDRALNAARKATPKSTEALLEVKVAEALLASGKKKQAYDVLHEAEGNSVDESNTPRRIELLGGIVDGYVDTGNLKDAKELADKIHELALLQSPFPADELSAAAKAYNDVGDRVQAIKVLHEAVNKLPDPHKVIAIGPTLGSISGSTLGIGNSIRSSIAAEFYRAADQKDFDEQQALLPPDYQTQTWLELYSVSSGRHELSPTTDEVLDAIVPSYRIRFLSDVAATLVGSGKQEEAKKLLQKGISEYTANQSPRVLLYLAKVAYAGGFSDLVTNALHKAAVAAQSNKEKGKRATELAAVAASEHELQDQ